ncbi:MAG: class I SAM-dependent methyltransferase [Spongiibacteraceae bacterium]
MSDRQILESWQRNAAPWSRAVRNNAIASRVAVTNAAIVSAVSRLEPSSLLDVGCGEGWLLRELAGLPIKTYGIDGVAELIAQASAAGESDCYCMSYEDFAAGAWRISVAAMVFNFSLLGEDIVERVLPAASRQLDAGGHCIIQTLHPAFYNAGQNYQSGWREEQWQDIGDGSSGVAPWYFRTLSAWFALFARCDLRLVAIDEPTAASDAQPASIIFTLAVAA